MTHNFNNIISTEPKNSCPRPLTTAAASPLRTIEMQTLPSPLLTFNDYSLRATYDLGFDLSTTNKKKNFKEKIT